MSILRYSYRLYPTAVQQSALIKLFGCVRVVWNDAVARAQDGARYPGFTVASRLLTESKKTPERAWLNDVSSVALQQSIRELPSEPKTAAVTLDAAGRYHVTFTVEKVDLPIKGGEPVGVDLGIKAFSALSTGELVRAPDYPFSRRDSFRCAFSIRRSNRRERVRLRVAKLHARLADTRRDFLEKFSTRLVREHSLIVLDRLARAISRQGWRTFRTMVESKCRRYGREARIVGRWEPTSQVCSRCGQRWGRLGLDVREVVCKKCGEVHDRDINAAKNIVAAGLAETLNGRGEQVSRAVSSDIDAPLIEASTSGACSERMPIAPPLVSNCTDVEDQPCQT